MPTRSVVHSLFALLRLERLYLPVLLVREAAIDIHEDDERVTTLVPCERIPAHGTIACAGVVTVEDIRVCVVFPRAYDVPALAGGQQYEGKE